MYRSALSEVHVAGHTLWHLSQDHPIQGLRTGVASDPFLEEMPSDTLDSPTLGPIGPIPFFRPGGHQKHGSTIRNSLMIRLAEAGNSQISASGSLEDIPATIAALLGKSLPQGTDGKSLLQ